MIQTYTRLTVADNSGAKVIRLINIPGSGRRKFAIQTRQRMRDEDNTSRDR